MKIKLFLTSIKYNLFQFKVNLKKFCYNNPQMKKIISIVIVLFFAGAAFLVFGFGSVENFDRDSIGEVVNEITDKKEDKIEEVKLDFEKYDELSEYVANNPEPEKIIVTSTSTNSLGEIVYSTSTKIIEEEHLYPVKDAVYPKAGAILPFNRIIAYYGNFYSTRMGILGEFEEEEVLRRLQEEIDIWNEADPKIPALPAIHYIASTAQGQPGEEGLYTLRMPDEHIEKAIAMAEKINGITFLDLQIGLSTIERELPYIEEHLKNPIVHLAIDPEFSMKSGDRPGTVIGHFTDDDINFVINRLSEIVRENDLPPKVLVLHRFTQKMIRNYENIKPTEEVQVVVHMDGWGSPGRKVGTYNYIVAPEPIQFTGFKIFYGNDLKEEPHRLITPKELLELQPNPVYLQYQ